MKKILAIVLVAIIIGVGVYWYKNRVSNEVPVTTVSENTPVIENPVITPVVDKTKTTIGTSTQGKAITAYHYGTGTSEILFVGGIHGGYEWNTVQVAYQLMDYLAANPNAVPSNIKVTVIPVLNPDGLVKVVGDKDRFTLADISKSESVLTSGRFNANNVDLNRNFDCDWQTTGVWQSKKVSGGTAAFSEPESQAIKNYVETTKPTAVVTWYSAAGGVFSSSCHNGVSAETAAITKAFAKGSGYKAYESFDFYATTGDMVNWLAKIGTPAISVLLTDHTNTEWTKNQAGVEALLKYYTK